MSYILTKHGRCFRHASSGNAQFFLKEIARLEAETRVPSGFAQAYTTVSVEQDGLRAFLEAIPKQIPLTGLKMFSATEDSIGKLLAIYTRTEPLPKRIADSYPEELLKVGADYDGVIHLRD